MLNCAVQPKEQYKIFGHIHCSSQEDPTPLIGKHVSRQIKLITVHYHNIAIVHSMSECKNLLTNYLDVFNGELGSLPGLVLLQANKTIPLHTAAHRHMPVSMMLWVKKKLKNLEEFCVIIPINVPTDWNIQNFWGYLYLQLSGTLEQSTKAWMIPVTNHRCSAAKVNKYELLHHLRCQIHLVA